MHLRCWRILSFDCLSGLSVVLTHPWNEFSGVLILLISRSGSLSCLSSALKVFWTIHLWSSMIWSFYRIRASCIVIIALSCSLILVRNIVLHLSWGNWVVFASLGFHSLADLSAILIVNIHLVLLHGFLTLAQLGSFKASFANIRLVVSPIAYGCTYEHFLVFTTFRIEIFIVMTDPEVLSFWLRWFGVSSLIVCPVSLTRITVFHYLDKSLLAFNFLQFSWSFIHSKNLRVYWPVLPVLQGTMLQVALFLSRFGILDISGESFFYTP